MSAKHTLDFIRPIMERLAKSNSKAIDAHMKALAEFPNHVIVDRDKYQSLVAFYDNHVGTPCEQVRHAQEIEALRLEISRLSKPADDWNFSWYREGKGVIRIKVKVKGIEVVNQTVKL